MDTPSGKVVKDLVNSGVKLGISSRGMGSVQEQMGASMVQEDFELICFDIVSEPSTPDAYIYPDNKPKISPLLFMKRRLMKIRPKLSETYLKDFKRLIRGNNE